MGITIYYKGRLKSAKLIPAIISEIEDVAYTMSWVANRIDFNVPVNTLLLNEMDLPDCKSLKISGIIFLPHPRSEHLGFVFTPDGHLFNVGFLAALEGACENFSVELVRQEFCKTQFAGKDAHMATVRFLKYLSTKYFEEFTASDDAQFWETEDATICEDNFNKMNMAMDIFEGVLTKLDQEIRMGGRLSGDGILGKIVDLLQNRKDSKDRPEF